VKAGRAWTCAYTIGIAALPVAVPVAAYTVVDDGIPAALTATPGDPARGRAIAASRQQGLCLLCHSGPVPEERFQGNLAPPLDGAGSRYSVAQLRLRVADMRRLNPASLMPSLHPAPAALNTDEHAAWRVGAAWRGRPVLDAQQVEDVVAWLQTLRASPESAGMARADGTP
jgi:sulfur-oxidizing protein SoxX